MHYDNALPIAAEAPALPRTRVPKETVPRRWPALASVMVARDGVVMSPADRLEQVLVTMSLTAYFGLVTGLYYAYATGATNPAYGLMFGSAWVAVPLVTLLTVLVLHLLKRQYLDDHPLLYPLLLLGGAIPPLVVSLLLGVSHEYALLPDIRDLYLVDGLVTLGGLMWTYAIGFWSPRWPSPSR